MSERALCAYCRADFSDINPFRRLLAVTEHILECPKHPMRTVERERDEARSELERERMRLAACGVVAMADTPESAVEAREMHPDYRSASCDDVARMVDALIEARRNEAEVRAILAAMVGPALAETAEIRRVEAGGDEGATP